MNAFNIYWLFLFLVAKIGERLNENKELQKESFVHNTLTALDEELITKMNRVQNQFLDLPSVQEKLQLLERINTVLDPEKTQSLEKVLPPSIVVTQKGRPKNTKREKIGLEHVYDNLDGQINKKAKNNNSASYQKK